MLDEMGLLDWYRYQGLSEQEINIVLTKMVEMVTLNPKAEMIVTQQPEGL